MSDFGPDEWAERERLDHIAQQHDEDRIAKERELRDRLAELEAELARRAKADERMTELAADHVSEYAQRAADAEDWAGQLYTAWWSARIRAARNDQHGDLLRRALGTTITERDQFKATIARVQELAKAAKVAFGAMCTCPKCESEDWDADFEPHPSRPLAWDLDPVDVLAALAALDQTDLPAVREFAAGLDPREEG